MTKIRNSKPVLVIEYWDLRFVCNLVLGVWDFMDSVTLADSIMRERPPKLLRGRSNHGPLARIPYSSQLLTSIKPYLAA
jgi:hypothetical protein